LESSDDARLAEYTALRAEIQRRSTTQQALVALNLAASATIAGAVVASRLDDEFLLVLPLVSSVLGLLWLDHARNIELIGSYIANKLWLWEPSWETYARQLERRMRSQVLEFALPMSLVFAGGSVAALVITALGGLHGSGTYVLWGLGFVLASLYLVAWIPFVAKQLRATKKESSPHNTPSPERRIGGL
jgi:hypothetical protein